MVEKSVGADLLSSLLKRGCREIVKRCSRKACFACKEGKLNFRGIYKSKRPI